MAAARGRSILVRAVLAEGALVALKDGDVDRHDQLAADAAVKPGDVDVIVLGQFSLARARPVVERAAGRQVITTPESAVAALRIMLTK